MMFQSYDDKFESMKINQLETQISTLQGQVAALKAVLINVLPSEDEAAALGLHKEWDEAQELLAAIDFPALSTQPSQYIEKWLPIETAPKDGTRVLLFHPYRGVMVDKGLIITGHYLETWDEMRNTFRCDWVQGDFVIKPTHWQPLPAPPQALTKEDR